MVVLKPILIVVYNRPNVYVEEEDVLSDKDPAMGSHNVRSRTTVYIDRSDFCGVDGKDCFRIGVGKATCLLKASFSHQCSIIQER